MHPIGLLSALLATGLAGQAPTYEEKAKWLAENAVSVRSVDPSDVDFSDLQPLKKALKDVQVVCLGEQSHWDGQVFLAKCRLVKFLHEEMGYDVLAWESGMFDLWQTDQMLAERKPVDDLLNAGVFAIWTRSKQVKPVFEYALETQNSKRPLRFAGFDSQFSTRNSPTRFADALFAFIDKADANLVSTSQREAFRDAMNAMQAPFDAEKHEARRQAIQTVDDIFRVNRQTLLKAHPELEVDRFGRFLTNTVTFEGMRASRAPGQTPKVTDNNVRDISMGENLAWLADTAYKGKKIIVWAASFHIMRNAASVNTGNIRFTYKDLVPMGQVAWDKLGPNRMYTMMFTAYNGQVGNVNNPPSPLPLPRPGSMDALFGETQKPHLFLDFRSLPTDHWLRKPMTAGPLGYAAFTADWTNVFDSVFFIRTMTPSERIQG